MKKTMMCQLQIARKILKKPCDKTAFEYTMKLQKYFIALGEEKEARQLDRMINLVYQTIDAKLKQKTINDFFQKA